MGTALKAELTSISLVIEMEEADNEMQKKRKWMASLMEGQSISEPAAKKTANVYGADWYATNNAMFPALVVHRDAISRALQHHMGGPTSKHEMSSIICEYALLPPSSRFYCPEEQKAVASARHGMESKTIPASPAFQRDSEWWHRGGVDVHAIETCRFRWDAQPSAAVEECRLVVSSTVTYPLRRRYPLFLHYGDCNVSNHTINHTINEDDDDDPADCTCRIQTEIATCLEPEKVKEYDVFEEEADLTGVTGLIVASLSFYYREFLNKRCQCGGQQCKARG